MSAQKEASVQAPVSAPHNAPEKPNIGIDIHAPFNNSEAPPMFPKNKENPPAPNTAVHEFLHALVLESLGYTPGEVSVKREGNSLGHVKVKGWVHPAHFQVMAAASSVGFDGYVPEGTGSDKRQIGQLAIYGGHSHDGAVAKASSIINGFITRYGSEFIHRAAKLLHERQVVNGSIRGLMAQAAYELQMERGQTDDGAQFMFRYQRMQEQRALREEQRQKESGEPKRETILSTFIGDRKRISLVEDGKIIVGTSYCGICGRPAGEHAGDCTKLKEKQKGETGKTVFPSGKPQQESSILNK